MKQIGAREIAQLLCVCGTNMRAYVSMKKLGTVCVTSGAWEILELAAARSAKTGSCGFNDIPVS